MSLINQQVPAFKATAYHNGKFVPVSEQAFKGKPGMKAGELTLFELELISFIEPPQAPPDVAAAQGAAGLRGPRPPPCCGGVGIVPA